RRPEPPHHQVRAVAERVLDQLQVPLDAAGKADFFGVGADGIVGGLPAPVLLGVAVPAFPARFTAVRLLFAPAAQERAEQLVEKRFHERSAPARRKNATAASSSGVSSAAKCGQARRRRRNTKISSTWASVGSMNSCQMKTAVTTNNSSQAG